MLKPLKNSRDVQTLLDRCAAQQTTRDIRLGVRGKRSVSIYSFPFNPEPPEIGVWDVWYTMPDTHIEEALQEQHGGILTPEMPSLSIRGGFGF